MIGIYSITNIITGQRYIGQSINIHQRWTTHKRDLTNNRHENSHLQEAFNVYGESVFQYEVLEECEQSELKEKEKFWITKYDSKNSGYNMCDGGGGLSNPTDDVRRKISEGLRGERNGFYGVSLKGSLNPNYGKHLSAETRAKISLAAKNRPREKSTRRIPVQASTGEVFQSAVIAAEWLGVSDGSGIGKCCRGQSKTAGIHPVTGERLSWKFRDDLK